MLIAVLSDKTISQLLKAEYEINPCELGKWWLILLNGLTFINLWAEYDKAPHGNCKLTVFKIKNSCYIKWDQNNFAELTQRKSP